MPGPWQSTRVLVTVKAYPQISDVGENVCVAGIDLSTNTWIRLFPLPFRDLPPLQQFKKYAVIELAVRKSRSDTRPESHTPDMSSIQVVEGPLPAGNWKERQEAVLPLMASSMCEIQRRQELDRTSLGLFRPAELLEFEVEPRTDRDWSPEKQMIIDQGNIFGGEKTPLEKIPYRFLYRYRCDEAGCRSHRQTIVDWEMSQAFRNFRNRDGEASALDQVVQKFRDMMWSPKRSTFLYTGNQAAHPKGFLVLGVFYPPARGVRP